MVDPGRSGNENPRMVSDSVKGLQRTSSTVASRPVRSRTVSTITFLAITGTRKKPTSP